MIIKRSRKYLREIFGAVIVFGLLISTAVFYRATPDPSPGAPPAATPPTESVESASPSQRPSAATRETASPEVVDDTAPDPVSATDGPAQVPVEALPQDGPGVTEPGILMIVSPTSQGSLLLTEQFVLTEPIDEIVLSPAASQRAGAKFAQAKPVATAVQLTADGDTIEVSKDVTGDVVVDVGGVTSGVVSYRLEGTSIRSAPSTARRALAAAAPLTHLPVDDLPVHVVAAGPSVLALNCPLLTLSERACGEGTSLAVQTLSPLIFTEAVFTIQFDLPRT